MRYTLFHIYFRFQAAIFNFPPIPTSPYTNICPIMLFDAKNMRITLKFYIYSICNVRFRCFRFHVRHFDFRLKSHRIVHRALLLSAAVTLASLKTYAATLNLLPKAIHALLIRWSPRQSLFHQKIIHATFDNGLDYFENLNVILSGFDGSRYTPKCNGKFRRATEILKKNEGGATLHLSPLFEG